MKTKTSTKQPSNSTTGIRDEYRAELRRRVAAVEKKANEEIPMDEFLAGWLKA